MSTQSGVLTPQLDTGTVNAENPWPGLLPFHEADRAWFQGRQTETAELLRLVLRERLTVLFGPSGLGKTSLLQAGLFPVARQEQILPIYIRLDHASSQVTLVDQVKQAIAGAAAIADTEAPEMEPGETLWEYFHRRDADFWDRRNRPVVPLLVFDQFEEIFTLGRAGQERAHATEVFLDELADLAEGTPPVSVEARVEDQPDQAGQFSFGTHRYKLLLGVREDFLPDLESLRRRMSAIALNRLRLRRMNGEAALLAVDQAPALIDRATAERVVRFVAADRPGRPLADLEVEPALLSVVCRELNNKRRQQIPQQARITASLLEGSQAQVIGDFYERSVADQAPAVRSFIEERLLTVSGYRDSIALENALNMPGVTHGAIDSLVERRLVRIEDRGAGQRLELTHDLLAGVVRASRDRRRQSEAEERERRARLEAEELAQTTIRQLRRSRLLAAVFLVLALVAITGLVIAYSAQKRAVAAEKTADFERNIAFQAQRTAEATAAREEEARKAADLAKIEAQRAEAEAMRSKDEADRARVYAEGQRANALASAASAETAAQQEREQRALAQAATARAEVSAKQAADQAALANRQRELAETAQQGEKAQRDRAELQSKELAKALAESDVLEASRQVDLGKRPEAFAYLGRALREDPASMAAKSLMFDLMIRGNAGVPAEPLRIDGRIYPLTHDPLRLSDRVLFASFSPDGRLVVTASFDKTAQVWDVESGMPVGEPLRHGGLVNSAVFSPDGTRILTASQDGTAQIWDIRAGPPAKLVMRHSLPVDFAAFSLDGTLVVTASQDNTAQIWDAQTGAKSKGPLVHKRPVTSAAFSPDGKYLVTGSWDGAQIWDLASGTSEPIRALTDKGQINFVGYSPDGRRIVTASSDGTAEVWDSGSLVGQPMRHGRPVNSAAFSPDGLRIVTASDDNTARVWEAATGTPIGAPLRPKGPPLERENRVNSAQFSPDGRRVVTASYDHTAQTWEVWLAHNDDASLLSSLAEVEGGYGIESLPALKPLADKAERLAKLRELVDQARSDNATAAFVHWCLSFPK